MRHARPDYDERIQDGAGLIPEDEPVLLIRGQDAAACATGLFWASENVRLGGDPAVSDLVRDHVQRIADWQAEHGAKLADVPAVSG